jgi:hypothetical protein
MAKKQMKMECFFGRVGLGDVTGSIPVKFSRGNLELEVADEVLCGRRLDVHMVAFAKGENPEQKRLSGMERHEVSLQCDITGYKVTPKAISASMKFNMESVEEVALKHFAMRDGVLTIKNVGELVSDDEPEEDDE